MAADSSLMGRWANFFSKPAVPAGMVLLAGLIVGLGEMQSRPIRAQVERERANQIKREAAMEQALGQAGVRTRASSPGLMVQRRPTWSAWTPELVTTISFSGLSVTPW